MHTAQSHSRTSGKQALGPVAAPYANSGRALGLGVPFATLRHSPFELLPGISGAVSFPLQRQMVDKIGR